jgi:glycosyltransferase involved in cell wall biosynthesis
MRILMLTDFYPPIIGGLELHVRNLSTELVRRGHEVAVITLWHAELAMEEFDSGVHIYRIRGTLQRATRMFRESDRRFSPPLPDPEALLAIRRIIKEFQPDVIHAHNWLMYSFLPLKRWSGAPLVVTLHDYGLACPKKTLMRDEAICSGPRLGQCLPCSAKHYGVVKGAPTVLANAAMSQAARAAVDMFLAVSHAVAEGNQLPGGRSAYRVIPNFVSDQVGIDLEVTAPELSQLPDEDYLLYVGELSHHKGLGVLLKAYAQLQSPPPLVLIGPSGSDAPKTFPAGVHVCGKWPNHAVMQARRRSIAALVPSIWPDPCPTVVMEALASGQPVIASRVGGLPDLIADGETGLLVPPGDAAMLRQAIERLIADPELRARMGAEGARRVTAFRAATVVSQIEQVYADLQCAPSARAAANKSIG